MSEYNVESWEKRGDYPARLYVRESIITEIITWAFEGLPDEILVGLDAPDHQFIRTEIDELFANEGENKDLYGGQGLIVSEAAFVNQGNAMSVHHLPEEWTDAAFGAERGRRASRFLHWLHTHPNAPAIPSGADADAAQDTTGLDLILGLEFTPNTGFPWFDDGSGGRRKLGNSAKRNGPNRGSRSRSGRRRGRMRSKRPVLGRAHTGHTIHGLELISFHRTGVGINIVFVDEDGWPLGWTQILEESKSKPSNL